MTRVFGKILFGIWMLIASANAGLTQANFLDALTQTNATALVRVLVIGDALSGGLGAGMTRIAETSSNVEVVFRVNESSGLARPDVYDWTLKLPNMLEGQSYTSAVIMIGTNDRRDIAEDAFNSPAWRTTYVSRIDAMIALLKAQGIKVFWTGLPPMANPEYDRSMTVLNSLFKERVELQGETFIDLRAPLLGPTGQYTDLGPDEAGAQKKYRSRDGVNFYKLGNNRMAQIVLGAIKARIADDAFIAGTPKETEFAKLPATPIFVQAVSDGTIVSIDSAALAMQLNRVAQETENTNGASASDRVVSETSIAEKGSNADRLLSTGVPAAAPIGRFDDFSQTPLSSAN